MLSLENFTSGWKKKFPNIGLAKTHFLIAVSGGVDSIVLAYLMKQMGANCTIAHANFQLRETESNRDEQFVKTFSDSLQLDCKIQKFETSQYATTYKLGIQEAAREIRYAWFDTLIQTILLEKKQPVILLTAHHAGDQVETVLMQFFRGTGLHGLTGIPIQRKRRTSASKQDHIDLVRPLLDYTKQEIVSFAHLNGIQFVEDSSNLKDDYTRNLFRNKIIPQVESIFPKASKNIIETVARLKEADDIVHNTVNNFWKKGIRLKKGIQTIPLNYWKNVLGNSTYCWGLIQQFGFKASQIQEVEKLLNAANGAYISADTFRLVKWDNEIQIVPNQSSNEYQIINEGQLNVTMQWGDIVIEYLNQGALYELEKDAHYAYLNAAAISWPLLLRTWQPTDYFYPLGLRKKKKLNHFLGSLKLSPVEKSRVVILSSGDKIVWVVGKRIDERFKISSNTEKVLKIKLLDKF